MAPDLHPQDQRDLWEVGGGPPRHRSLVGDVLGEVLGEVDIAGSGHDAD
jgi:hypothetical protein